MTASTAGSGRRISASSQRTMRSFTAAITPALFADDCHESVLVVLLGVRENRS